MLLRVSLTTYTPSFLSLTLYYYGSQGKSYQQEAFVICSLKYPQYFIFCVTSIDHENVYVICLLGVRLLGDIDQVDPFVKSYID